MVIRLLELLFFLVILIGLPNWIWATFDARSQRFHPLERPMVIAGTIVFMALFGTMVQFFLRPEQSRGVTYDVEIAWTNIAMSTFVMFVLASTAGNIIYRFRYRFAHLESAEESYGAEHPETRMEETGNPYQPPST